VSLADAVAELEEQLDEARDRILMLEGVDADCAFASDQLETVLEAIEDHRRGLISTEELYERTVGR
jgi:hypothetical protein